MPKNTKNEQSELPFARTVHQFEPITGKSGEQRWYYVALIYKQEMLALDDGGNWVWIPHDCVRATPHLFSDRKKARAVANTYKHAVVETYLWSVDAPPWRE